MSPQESPCVAARNGRAEVASGGVLASPRGSEEMTLVSRLSLCSSYFFTLVIVRLVSSVSQDCARHRSPPPLNDGVLSKVGGALEGSRFV